jgi:hypothetical protein
MKMGKLIQKFIKFGDDELLGVKDEEGKVWLGIKKVCKDIGLSEKQADNEVRKIQNNLLFARHGSVKMMHLKFEGHEKLRDTIVIHENDVTIWLAQIALTPTMKEKNPKAVEKLLDYQDNCAKVLHSAFFETNEQKEKLFDDLGLEGKIVNLESKIDAQTGELKETKDRLNTLIDNSTINSRQASRLLTHAKDRVSTMLGGAHSAEYKKNSRTYFKNLWLQLCQEFEVTTYKDLNPLNYGSAVTFVSNGSYNH